MCVIVFSLLQVYLLTLLQRSISPSGRAEVSSKESDDEADRVDHQEARQQRRRNHFA